MVNLDTIEIDNLLEEAKSTHFLRISKRLEDDSNYVVTAFRPLSPVPVHRTPENEVTVFALRGKADVVLYDESGGITNRLSLDGQNPSLGIKLKKGQWYTVELRSPFVLLTQGERELDKIAPENIMY